MNPRDDEPPFDDSDSSEEELVEELRTEMVRLQAELDQLAAAARDRSTEITELRLRLAELEHLVALLQLRARRSIRLWAVTAALYGLALGFALSWLLRF